MQWVEQENRANTKAGLIARLFSSQLEAPGVECCAQSTIMASARSRIAQNSERPFYFCLHTSLKV